MESIQENQKSGSPWGGYIIAGIVLPFAEYFGNGVVAFIIAIGAGFCYYPLKTRLKIKNEVFKIILTFLILFVVSILLVGFLTNLLG